MEKQRGPEVLSRAKVPSINEADKAALSSWITPVASWNTTSTKEFSLWYSLPRRLERHQGQSKNSRRSSLVLTMTHGRKSLTILKGAKSCETKRTTADGESRRPRKFEPANLQEFPPPPVRTVKRIYRAKIRICHLLKNIIPSPRMIICLRRTDLTRCPADEICKRFLILWSLTPSRTDVFTLCALSSFSRKAR